MKNRRRAKANHGAAELAVVGLIGAGSAITLGRGYLAERRSKALDVELVRALQPWSFDPSVRLSPPEDAGNFSPRLRDLADPNALTPAFDARKRQLLAQAASRDIHVGADRRGVLYLGLPGQPPVEVEFSRRFRKRNSSETSKAVMVDDLKHRRYVPTDDEVIRWKDHAQDSGVRAWLRQEWRRRIAEATNDAARVAPDALQSLTRATAVQYRRGLTTRRFLVEALEARGRSEGPSVPSDYGTEVEFIPHEKIEGDKVAWSIRRGNVIFAAVGGDDYRRGSATSPAQGMLALELFDPTHHNYYGFFPASDAPRIYEEVKAGTVDDDGMPHRYEEIRDAAADMRLLSHMTHRMLYSSAQNHTRYQNASPTPSAGVRAGSRSLVSAKLPTWLRGHPYRTLLYATKKEARDAGHHPSTLAFVETMMGNVAVAIMQHESVLTRDGFWVSLVHDPARYPDTVRKRNDATSAVAGLTAAEPWAFAQYDDPIFGSWGVAIEPDGADLYRFDGAVWRPAGRASWNAKRGRLEHVSAPEVVIAGLNRAALASPHANEALRQYLRSVIGTAFTGNRSDLPALTNGADTVFRAVARARCSDAKATKSRPGTKAAESALAARDHDLAVAKVALREVCGRGMKPIAPGTPCEVALDALRAAGPETPCAIGAPPCPHRVSEELFSAWRSGAFPSIGPYETDKPHTMGDDPCCYYHPHTQARLRLRREVEKTIAAPIGSQEWVNAIKAAELSAPSDLVAAWHKCDDAMTRRVDPLSAVTGAGVGSSGNFLLLQAFYRAAKRNDEDRMAETYAALLRAFGHLPDLETLAELDSNFWDLAIQEARDSGNLGFKRWVQSHGGKSGRTVFRRFDTASGTLR